MKDSYHRDIVNILLEAGEGGMRSCVVARRLYNMHANLFASSLVYETLRTDVEQYLWRETKRRFTIFARKAYGIYAIKPSMAVQLDLFIDLPQEKEEVVAVSSSPQAIQLDLFAELGF